MLKKIFTVFLLGITFKSLSQTKLLNDSIKIDNSTILIATSTDQKDYEFCITKLKDITKELALLNN